MKLQDVNNALLIWGVLSQDGLGQIKEGKSLVIVPENRPYFIGLRHNAGLLKKENINFVYCTDNMIGLLFYKNKIKETFFFYKELNNNGIIGGCGSLYVCLLSKIHNIPIKLNPQANLEFASSCGASCFIMDAGPDTRIREEGLISGAEDEFVEMEVLK